MTVTFSLTLNDIYPPSNPLHTAFAADLAQAAADWSHYLNSNANIRVQVDVGNFPSNAGFVIQNDSQDFVPVGSGSPVLGRTLVEPWGEYALTTGGHVSGSTSDIHIFVSSSAPLYINPNPAAGGPVPSGEYDATTMFRKALAYGLGWASMTTTNASLADYWETALDHYVQPSPGGATCVSLGVDLIGAMELTGPAAEAVYGGPVPLVTPPQNYHEADVHVGNTPTIAGSSDMMAVTQNIVGQSLQISPLDLAIMQDAGVPIITGGVSCFAEGTRIATRDGEVAIENLREGDLVLTVAGHLAPIRWIGRRQVNCRNHPAAERISPIRIAPHAFGAERPRRAVLLSPDHAVFIENVLIPIRMLVNHSTVMAIAVDAVTYFHIELPRHDVVLADGLPAESYLENGGRSAFERLGEPMQLHAQFQPCAGAAALVWESFGGAPLVVDGDVVRRILAQLEWQAGMLDMAGAGFEQPTLDSWSRAA